MRTVKFRGQIDGAWHYLTLDDAHQGEYLEAKQFWNMVERETVGEWTSQVDCKQQDIYEGDILRLESSYHKTYEVYWNDDRWGLRHGPLNDYDNGDYYRGDDINNWHEFEIAGNIYEHPHLLF